MKLNIKIVFHRKSKIQRHIYLLNS